MSTQRYINALYLNNAAVTFMAHGEYRIAAAASEGALQLIKSLVQVPDASEPSFQTSTKANALANLERSIVQETAQRLANLNLQTNVPKNCPIQLNSVGFDGSLGSHQCDSDCATAIVINDTTMDDLNGTTPSILLSNYALAQLCLSQVKESCGLNSVDGALRLLDMSLGTLGFHQRTMEVNEGNMFVAFSILGNICHILRQDGKSSHRETLVAAHQELVLLQEVSLQLTSVSSSFVPVAGAA